MGAVKALILLLLLCLGLAACGEPDPVLPAGVEQDGNVFTIPADTQTSYYWLCQKFYYRYAEVGKIDLLKNGDTRIICRDPGE